MRWIRAAVVAGAAVVLGGAAVLAPVGAPPGDGSGHEAAPRAAIASPSTVALATSASTTAAPPNSPPTTSPTTGPEAEPTGRIVTDDPALEALATRLLTDPRVARHDVGVWVATGEPVLAVDAEVALRPASVQKLATAMAVLDRIEPTFAFTTEVRSAVLPDAAGVVHGDVSVVGGGDPTLARAGPHSLDSLAGQLWAAGVRRIEGRVLVDTSRWGPEVGAASWLGWQQPTYIGWLSALIADENRWQAGPDTAQPGLANGRVFTDALASRGVVVTGGVAPGGPAGGYRLTAAYSASRDFLVQRMLLESDNLIAEAWVRELGVRLQGVGSHPAGIAVVDDVLAQLDPAAAPGAGSVTGDGSGLSRDDLRPAAGWGALLVAAHERPWWPSLEVGLPTAAMTGTLQSRFGGTAAAGVVHAKTGTTIPARSLAGVLTARSGTPVTFVVIVNGTDADPPIDAEGAIDAFVAGLVTTL